MDELKIVVKQEVGKIEFNFEECKAILVEKMQEYRNLVVTEDSIVDYKKDVAKLNKDIKTLEDYRKSVKANCLKQYDEYVIKSDELKGLIQEPINEITDQLKDFEEERKKKKKIAIEQIYSELIGEMKEYLPISRIYDARWENKGTSIKSIRESIDEVVSSTEMAVNTIKEMNSEIEEKLLQAYKSDLSLNNAIVSANKHMQVKAEILARENARRQAEEERQKELEIERIRKEERARILEIEKIKEEERQKVADEIKKAEEEKERIAVAEKIATLDLAGMLDLEEAFDADEEDKSFEVDEPFDVEMGLPFVMDDEIRSKFWVIATIEQMDLLENYLNSEGMDYEREDSHE